MSTATQILKGGRQRLGPFKTISLLVIAGAFLWLLWLFSDLVLLLGIALLVAYLLSPIVDRFQRIGLPRSLASVLVLAIVIALLAFLVSYLIPFIAQQSSDIRDLLGDNRLRGTVETLEVSLSEYFRISAGAITAAYDQMAEALKDQDRITGILQYTFGVATNIVYAILIVPVFTFFFLKDGRKIRFSLLNLVPNKYLEIFIDLIDKVETDIGQYLRALLVRTIIVSIAATSLLWIVGLENSLVVGLFTGVANTIPYFGPVIGLVAGAIVGVGQTGDFSMLLGVSIAMLIVQALDAIILQPVIFSRAGNIHPLMILLVVLIGAEVAGILGMLLAIPATFILRVSIKQLAWSLRSYHVLRAA